MNRIRDYLHDAPWYARKATLPVRNAAYRATRPLRSARGQYRNYRNRRFLQTGKGFWMERHTRGLRSSLPVYRDRINPGTGRPRRDDAEIYGRRDMRLAHARQSGRFDSSRAWENSPDAYRSNVRARADGDWAKRLDCVTGRTGRLPQEQSRGRSR